jgi:cellulose synthase/poly-beta-1,6-N-acetylglucosamine synthase-like glycosyltransferase
LARHDLRLPLLTAVAIPIYAYFGYPVTLIALTRILKRGVEKENITPRISLLILAFNKAANIERKIPNSLALDYPPESMEIVVACDGSSDDTPSLQVTWQAPVRRRGAFAC